MARPHGRTAGMEIRLRPVARSAPEILSFDALALQPDPDDADRDHADDDRKCDRPAADPYIADHLAFGLVLSDLAIALLVILVGRAHRPLPVTPGFQVRAVVAGFNVASIDDVC